MNIIDNIELLSCLPGISGHEEAVRNEICKQLDGICEYEIDTLGNIIAFKKGNNSPKNKLMLSAHMDEIGFIITSIDDDGMLRFDNVGGIDPRVIFGKAVKIGKNSLPGVIGGNPVHQHTNDELLKLVDTDSLFIDIGASSKEEAAEYVSPGDSVVYQADFVEMGNDTIVGKALDDRAGCALMLDLIAQDLEYDCYFVFTVQEEIGCIGAETAAYSLQPDIGIIIETTTASDIAGVPETKHVCHQGKGPVISFMDRGTLYPRDLYSRVFEVAKANNVPCQAKEGIFGGNEARSIQTSGSGSKVVAVSMPARYLHSPSNSLNKTDIENTGKLLKLLINDLATAEV